MTKVDILKEKIIHLYSNENSIYKITKDLNVPKSTLIRRLRKWGFSDEKINFGHKGNLNNLLKDKQELAIKLFEEGKSCGEISRILGYSSCCTWKLLNKLGISMSDYKYSVDEEFFKIINTQEKAYVLGWMYSDGNICANKSFRISIHVKDEEILHKIRKILKYEGPIKHIKTKKVNCGDQVSLVISRKTMVNDLINLGCYNNKSLILKLPTFDLVPQELFYHFLRGYFDGDGGVHITKSNKIGYVGITGSYCFITSLSEFLVNYSPKIYASNKNIQQDKCAHTLRITKQENIIPFINCLYKDANIYLDRKYQLIRTFLK